MQFLTMRNDGITARMNGLSRQQDFEELAKACGLMPQDVPIGHYLVSYGRGHYTVPWWTFWDFHKPDVSEMNVQMSWVTEDAWYEAAMIYDSADRFAQISRWLLSNGVSSEIYTEPYPRMRVDANQQVRFETYNWVVLTISLGKKSVAEICTFAEVMESIRADGVLDAADCTEDDLRFGN